MVEWRYNTRILNLGINEDTCSVAWPISNEEDMGWAPELVWMF
jgi:hypothetical protein